MSVEANLCFIIKSDQVMLIHKKRGFGNSVYNGPGGKKEVDETNMQSVIREVKEEVGVNIINPLHRGVLTFRKEPSREIEWIVHVYVVFEYKGQLIETEEAKPGWYAFENVPYANMWADDIYWLPHVLFGKQVEAEFLYSEDWSSIENYSLLISDLDE